MGQHRTEDKNNHKEADEAEGFAHDGKNGVINRLGKIAGRLDGVANTDAGKTAGANSKHGVVDMVGRIGGFATGKGSNPGVDTLHAVR